MNSQATSIKTGFAKLLCVGLLGVAIAAACAIAPAASSAAGTSSLKPSTKHVACGQQQVGGAKDCAHVFFKNTTSSPVTISATGIENSQSSFGADGIGFSLSCRPGAIVPAGESCGLNAFFVPAHTGRFFGAKLYVTDATSGVRTRVALTGIGI